MSVKQTKRHLVEGLKYIDSPLNSFRMIYLGTIFIQIAPLQLSSLFIHRLKSTRSGIYIVFFLDRLMLRLQFRPRLVTAIEVGDLLR